MLTYTHEHYQYKYDESQRSEEHRLCYFVIFYCCFTQERS